MFVNKDKFWSAVRDLRSGISLSDYKVKQHKSLDNIIETVTEEGQMAEGLSLQDDVARVIKRIKEAKEKDLLDKKAGEILAKLKEEL